MMERGTPRYRSAHCTAVCKRLWSLQQTGQLCDIFLTAGGNEVIFAHRNVLAASSPFFLLNAGSSESDQAGEGLKIHVPDASGEVVREAVRFAYTGFVTLSADNVDGVLGLCEKWQLEEGVKQCAQFKAQQQRALGGGGGGRRLAARGRLRGSARQFRPRKRVRYTESDDGEDSGDGGDSESDVQTKQEPTTDNSEEHETESVTKASEDKAEVPHVKTKVEQESSERESNSEPVKVKVARTPPRSKRKRYRPLRIKRTPNRQVSNRDDANDEKGREKEDEQQEAGDLADVSKLQEGVEVASTKIKELISRTVRAAASGCAARGLRATHSLNKRPRVQRMRCVRCRGQYAAELLVAHKQSCSTCYKCKQTFGGPQEFSSHLAAGECRAQSDLKFDCDKCDKSFSRKISLDSHTMKYHWTDEMGEPNFLYCSVKGCAFQTVLLRNMQKHMKYTHSESRPVMCDICGAMSKNEYYLKIHKRTRHSEALSCDVCGLLVKTRQVLKSHKMRQHGQGTPDFLCSQCTYITFTKTELDKHMFHRHRVSLPSGNEGYTCPHCNWKCIQKTSMDQHIIRHTAKERNYPCSVCNKRFITKSDLRGHMVSHDPTRKKFKCPYCDYSTPYGKFKLRDHVSRIHENKDYKPWVCELCNYRTNVKGNLTSHLRKTHKMSVETNQHLISKVTPIVEAKAKAKDGETHSAPAGGTAGKNRSRKSADDGRQTRGSQPPGEAPASSSSSSSSLPPEMPGTVSVSTSVSELDQLSVSVTGSNHLQSSTKTSYLSDLPLGGGLVSEPGEAIPLFGVPSSFPSNISSPGGKGQPIVSQHLAMPGPLAAGVSSGAVIPPAHMNSPRIEPGGTPEVVYPGMRSHHQHHHHHHHHHHHPHLHHQPVQPHTTQHQPHQSQELNQQQERLQQPQQQQLQQQPHPHQQQQQPHSQQQSQHQHPHAPQMAQPLPLNMVTMANSRLVTPSDGGSAPQAMYMDNIINSLVSRSESMLS